jgi:hypothetical protein
MERRREGKEDEDGEKKEVECGEEGIEKEEEMYKKVVKMA